jgi:hypothetical protein
MYSYANEYGSDTDEDNAEEEYVDEETRIDHMLDIYHSLKDPRDAVHDSLDQLKTQLEDLTQDFISRDIVKYVIAPYLNIPCLPEIQGLSQVEIYPDPLRGKLELRSDTPQVEEFFQPYDLPPCNMDRVWYEPNYYRYYEDNEVTEKREFYCKMFYVSLTGYSKKDWYKCRRNFHSRRKWWKRYYQVKKLWYAFHLMLYPELKDGYWDGSFYSLKWTYKLNGVLQEKELSVGFVIRNANPFLWFEIPDDLLRKGPVDIQLQLRKEGEAVFESKTFRVK